MLISLSQVWNKTYNNLFLILSTALMAMHIVWVREHNRIANYLHVLNPLWCDEKLFQEARKIVIAELQHITFSEWLPVFFNEDLVSI